jgi:hypothetical protein
VEELVACLHTPSAGRAGITFTTALAAVVGPVETVVIRELPGGNANDTLLVEWDDKG